MRIISWNVNGLRSVHRRGFMASLQMHRPDVICLQEIKIDRESLPRELENLSGYHGSFNFGDRKGHAGVATYSRQKPVVAEEDVFGLISGRSLLLRLEHLAVLNVYMPHGGRDKSRLSEKLAMFDLLADFLRDWRDGPLVVAGDLNIAHEELDLARPSQNRHNTMFTLDERAKVSALIECGYYDAFRETHPTAQAFTWWPYMGQARERNLGWRIDYILPHRCLEQRVSAMDILCDVKGSDHCPVLLDLAATTTPTVDDDEGDVTGLSAEGERDGML